MYVENAITNSKKILREYRINTREIIWDSVHDWVKAAFNPNIKAAKGALPFLLIDFLSACERLSLSCLSSQEVGNLMKALQPQNTQFTIVNREHVWDQNQKYPHVLLDNKSEDGCCILAEMDPESFAVVFGAIYNAQENNPPLFFRILPEGLDPRLFTAGCLEIGCDNCEGLIHSVRIASAPNVSKLLTPQSGKFNEYYMIYT